MCPSSGACDYSVESPHWSYCSSFDVCWRFGVVGFEWYSCCRLKPATMMHGAINIRLPLCIRHALSTYYLYIIKHGFRYETMH